MNSPHFRIRLADPRAHKTTVHYVDGDTEVDISPLITGVTARLDAGDIADVSLDVLYADIDVIGYAPESQLRELVSLGKAAEKMIPQLQDKIGKEPHL